MSIFSNLFKEKYHQNDDYINTKEIELEFDSAEFIITLIDNEQIISEINTSIFLDNGNLSQFNNYEKDTDGFTYRIPMMKYLTEESFKYITNLKNIEVERSDGSNIFIYSQNIKTFSYKKVKKIKKKIIITGYRR